MIINEKDRMLPPPAYSSNEVPPPFSPSGRRRSALVTLISLPSHILLLIVYHTFPQTDDLDWNRLERQRKTLYWLSICLRLVNKQFYVACMHILRSTYLPAYESLIRPPYSSDPFPLPTSQSPYSSSSESSSPLDIVQRETSVLDFFIALKVREDVWADDSAFHLEREESFKDLFDWNQPRSRLEDLVRHYGLREGVVKTSTTPIVVPPPSPFGISADVLRPTGGSSRSSQKKTMKGGPEPVPFADVSVSFSPRTIGLMLGSGGKTKKTIVQIQRESRNETLEVSAKKLVKELKTWLYSKGY